MHVAKNGGWDMQLRRAIKLRQIGRFGDAQEQACERPFGAHCVADVAMHASLLILEPCKRGSCVRQRFYQ